MNFFFLLPSLNIIPTSVILNNVMFLNVPVHLHNKAI